MNPMYNINLENNFKDLYREYFNGKIPFEEYKRKSLEILETLLETLSEEDFMEFIHDGFFPYEE